MGLNPWFWPLFPPFLFVTFAPSLLHYEYTHSSVNIKNNFLIETFFSSLLLLLLIGNVGDYIKPRKHEQRLLRNVGVHTVVLDLLQIPYDEDDVRMKELMRLAHEFLQNFCLGNQQNQVLLNKHLDLFLNPGVSENQLFFYSFLIISVFP